MIGNEFVRDQNELLRELKKAPLNDLCRIVWKTGGPGQSSTYTTYLVLNEMDKKKFFVKC